MKKTFSQKKSAFSLIELSIVLIIIGLLIAGITGGASLIKNSQLRSVIGEARAYSVTVNAFYTQFNGLPGDYVKDVGAGSKGNGDGKIEYYTATVVNGSTNSEGNLAWLDLKAVGSLDATSFSATTVLPGTTDAPKIATNIPASKISGTGWGFDYNGTQNVIVLTGVPAAASTANTFVNGTPISTAALVPTDALSIDSKIDDGDAAAGKVRAVLSACASGSAYTVVTTTKACALSYQVDVNS